MYKGAEDETEPGWVNSEREQFTLYRDKDKNGYLDKDEVEARRDTCDELQVAGNSSSQSAFLVPVSQPEKIRGLRGVKNPCNQGPGSRSTGGLTIQLQ
ncbi:EF-Hand 1 calcium-binding site [Trinorchestia longiramus]|nr:EF-Hand 1 calcium-binding site [Trinorchestia longiramus]